MALKVKDLISQLSSCDPEADVIVYSKIDEGMGQASKVYTSEQSKDLYCKGDHITFSYPKYEEKPFIVIG